MENYINIEALNELQFNILFNSSLINNLPYLIWMYEFIDDDYKLIKWNKNQEIYTGYSAKELFHMRPMDFFKKEDEERLIKDIVTIFNDGKVKLFGDLKTKTGKLIPYYFEGYRFNFTDRQIFIGISVNVSDFALTQKKLKVSEKENKRLKAIGKENKIKLEAFTSQLIKDNITNNRISRQIDKLLTYNNTGNFKEDILKLKKIIESQQKDQYNWEQYKIRFNKVHKKFIKNLKAKHTNLTLSDLKFCTYIKINLPINEIASILYISTQSARKKKYRISKKLNLDRSDYLEIYLSKF
jgi:PAS domain S-box-containing protein